MAERLQNLAAAGTLAASDIMYVCQSPSSTPLNRKVTIEQTHAYHLSRGWPDSDASHRMLIACGSNLSADRTVTINPGDASRTITVSGNPTLNDWFDQSVKTSASPTFANATLSGKTSGRVPYFTTGGAFADSALLAFDGTTFSASCKQVHSYTIGNSTGEHTKAFSVSVTAGGSEDYAKECAYIQATGAWSGNSVSSAFSFVNQLPGTGTEGYIISRANFGAYGSVSGTTVGDNVGLAGKAGGGNQNFGLVGRAVFSKTGALNVGVVGAAYNTGAGSIAVAGHFRYGDDSPYFYTVYNCALLCDNGASAYPSLICCDQGTPVFEVLDGAVLRMTTGTAPTASDADTFKMYSKDIAAGNAAPHFRTEGGAVIKLYQQAHIADPSGGATTDTQARTAINALILALENAGLLATS